jgi:UPF0755 protein
MVIFFLILGSFFYLLDAVSKPASKNKEETVFVVKQGDGLKEISNNLKNENLIKSKLTFEVYAFVIRVNNKLQAGEYRLSYDMNIKKITDILSQGLVLNEVTIKIIEGWNKNEIGEYLEKQGIVSKNDFLAAANVTDSRKIIPNKTYGFLSEKVLNHGLEGYLFPDTYKIYKDSEPPDIIEKTLDNFDKKINSELRNEIKKQNKTIYEIVTMASILEKEVRKETDRKMVSDIFWRRIEAGMPLQSDATVNYVTGKSLLQPSLNDTQVDSLYNTYLYKGLPPGPICNPSLEAIKAAIYPQSNDYWYYLNKKDGTTVFSKTAEEHAENKAKYLD